MPLNLKTKPRPTSKEVSLPSGGYPYPEVFPTGRILVKAMTGEIERILFEGFSSNKGSKPYLKYLEVIRKCCSIPPEFDPKKLLVGDLMYLLASAKSLTYSKGYEFSSTCPSCGEKETSLIEIPEDMMSNRYPSDYPGSYPIELNSGDEVVIKFITVEDEMNCDSLVRNKISSGALTQDAYEYYLGLHILASHVVSVNEGMPESISETVSWLNSNTEDKEDLEALISKLTPGIVSQVPMICDHCGHDYNHFLPISRTFFRNRGTANPRDMPRGVRIGVIGKDEVDEEVVSSGQRDVSSDTQASDGGSTEQSES